MRRIGESSGKDEHNSNQQQQQNVIIHQISSCAHVDVDIVVVAGLVLFFSLCKTAQSRYTERYRERLRQRLKSISSWLKKSLAFFLLYVSSQCRRFLVTHCIKLN